MEFSPKLIPGADRSPTVLVPGDKRVKGRAVLEDAAADGMAGLPVDHVAQGAEAGRGINTRSTLPTGPR
jgi:hypothetical protein